MPRAKTKNPGRVQPAPEMTPTERDISFWLTVAKEFINENDEGEAGVIRYALEFLCLSHIQAQRDLVERLH